MAKLSPQKRAGLFRKIINIIKKDANITGHLSKGPDKFCVIGGLAHYGAGVDYQDMMRKPRSAGYWPNMPKMSTYDACRAVRRAFPVLSLYQTDDLVDINDGTRNTALRRRKLIAYIEKVKANPKHRAWMVE